MAFQARHAFLVTALVAAACFFIMLPSLLLWGILRGVGRFPRVADVALVLATVVAWSTPSVPLSMHLASRDAAEVRAYCESLVPRLDAWKAGRGAYPARIEEVADAAPLRAFEDGRCYYYTDSATFTFTVPDPAVLLGAYYYSSSRRQWRYSD